MSSIRDIIDEYMQGVSGIDTFCNRCLRTERWGGSVLLMVVDAAFTSIGLNYFLNVIPKVEEFNKQFVESGRINSLRELANIEIDELRESWNNMRSWLIAKNIALYLSSLSVGINDKDNLRKWAEKTSLERWSEDPIGQIKGVGIVTYQYLRIMGGIDTVMPDKIVKRVMNEIFQKAGRKPIQDNLEFVKKVEMVARSCGYKPIEVCWMAWLIQPEGVKMRRAQFTNFLSKI